MTAPAAARLRRLAGAALAGLSLCCVAVDAASAADLLARHRAGRRHGRLAALSGDAACPRAEPAVYKPRITNFREPLCYAARPYGLSRHLYDVSVDILVDRGD